MTTSPELFLAQEAWPLMPAETLFMLVAIIGVFLLAIAGLVFVLSRRSPYTEDVEAAKAAHVEPERMQVEYGKIKIGVSQVPGWSLRRVKADAFIALCDHTGWLGHGITKYVRDKADFGLDDAIERAAPIPSGEARAFPVKRLPAKQLIVANIYDERKLSSRELFIKGFLAAAEEAARHGCPSVVLLDPTEQFNYFETRTSSENIAELVVDAIRAAEGKIAAAKIIVTSKESLAAYKRAIAGRRAAA